MVVLISFSPNGKIYTLGYGEHDKGGITLFDSVNHQRILKIENSTERCLAFSPDSRYIATLKRKIQIFDISTGNKIWSFNPNFESVQSFCFSPDGNFFAAVGEFETDWDFNDPNMTSVALYDLKTGKNIWENRCGLYSKILFSPNGKNLYAIGTADVNRNLTSTVSSANVAKGFFKSIFREKFRLRFFDFDISPDGNTLICSGGYYHHKQESVPIIIVDLNSERKKVVDKHSTYFTLSKFKQLKGHTKSVNSVAFSPDGKLAVSTSSDIRIWDIESTKQIHKIKKYSSKATFSPDGTVLIFLSEGKLYYNDVASWKIIKERQIY